MMTKEDRTLPSDAPEEKSGLSKHTVSGLSGGCVETSLVLQRDQAVGAIDGISQ